VLCCKGGFGQLALASVRAVDLASGQAAMDAGEEHEQGRTSGREWLAPAWLAEHTKARSIARAARREALGLPPWGFVKKNLGTWNERRAAMRKRLAMQGHRRLTGKGPLPRAWWPKSRRLHGKQPPKVAVKQAPPEIQELTLTDECLEACALRLGKKERDLILREARLESEARRLGLWPLRSTASTPHCGSSDGLDSESDNTILRPRSRSRAFNTSPALAGTRRGLHDLGCLEVSSRVACGLTGV